MTSAEGAEPLARIAQFLDRFGRDRDLVLPPLGADGVGVVQRGSAVVSIHVLADKGVLLVLSKVADAVAAGDEATLRRLLEASFTATGDAAFALHPKTGEVYLRILRGLDGLDYAEFEDMLHTIATVADDWDDRMRAPT
jgi:hypothetical protein